MRNEKGQFGKGNPGGGRPKGSRNKTTIAARSFITDLIDKNQSQLEKDLKKLEPKERWDVYLKLMEFTLPKLQRIDANIEEEKREYKQVKLIIDDERNNNK